MQSARTIDDEIEIFVMIDNLKQKTKSGIYWQFFNQFTNYGLQFIVGIIIARILTPEDYGITALPSVFISVACVFVDSGFTLALIRKEKLNDKDLYTSFTYGLTLGLFFYVALYFASPLIANFYSCNILTDLIRITALAFIIKPFLTPLIVLQKRNLDFKSITKIAVVSKLISVATGLYLVFNDFGLWTLIAMSLVEDLTKLVFSTIIVRWYPRIKWSKESFLYLWHFGNKILISALLDTLYKNILPVFIGKYYSPYDLGVYNRAEGYSRLPSYQSMGIIENVTYPVLCKVQDNNDSLARYYRRMIKTSVFVVFPIMLILSALSRPLIIIMLTDKWEPCIILLQLLCFAFMWYPLNTLNLSLLQVKGRSDLYLRLEIVKKMIGLLLLVIALPINLIAVVISTILLNVLSVVINTHYTGHIIGVPLKEQLRDILPSLLMSVIMWGIVSLLISIINNLYIQLAAGSIVGFVVYLGMALLLKRPELDDVKYLINRKK